MSRKRKVIVASTVLLAGLVVWRLTPVYMFLAYADGSTLPAAPWVDLPEEAPQQQRVYVEAYRDVASSLMGPMDAHRDSIGAAAISAAVLIGDELIWAGASGWADIETQTAVTPETRFRVGSTAKALTATAMARLIENGQLQLDAPIEGLWEELPNQSWAKITPRQLSSHMAGLPHYGDNTDLAGLWQSVKLSDHYASVHDALAVFDGSELLFSPGTDFSYSSYGTVLLSAVMSKAAGKPYLDVMRDLVFEPNGMTATVVAPKDPGSMPDMATPYHLNQISASEFRLRPWRDIDLSHRLAGGGFASTSSDLAKLGKSYFYNSNPDAIPAEISAEMWTPQKLNSGEVNEQDYGLGWRVRYEEFLPGQQLMHVNHGGVSRGGQSWLMLIPAEEMAVALNINGRTDVFWDFGSFSIEIASAFLARKAELASQGRYSSGN